MRRATNGKYPRFFVWENVPGAFSSNRGLDFRTVLEEISQTKIPMPKDNRWANAGVVEWGEGSLAWRVLDAQYWGVPQRRKRIFLVADFGGRSAGEILFEREGVPRHSVAGREAREGASAGTESCVRAAVVRMRAGKPGGGKGALVSRDKSLTLAANANDQVLFCLYDMAHADEVMWRIEGGNQVPVVHAFSIAGNTIDRKPQNGGNGAGWQEDVSYTLNTIDRHAVYSVQRSDEYKKAKVSHTLSARDYKSATDLICKGHVRRLTPLEAERLQGLPENYTLIDDKSCSDTARYKALGNGMAQPVADWVIQRIEKMALGVGK